MVQKWIKSTVLSSTKLEPVDMATVVNEFITNLPSVKLSYSNTCMRTVPLKPPLFQVITSRNKMPKLPFQSNFCCYFRFEKFYEDVFKEMSQYGEI